MNANEVDTAIRWAREFYSSTHRVLKIADEVERLREIVASHSTIIATPEAPAWLDKPDGDGLYIIGNGVVMQLVSVHTSSLSGDRTYKSMAGNPQPLSGCRGWKWQPFVFPPPPPPTLPKSRMVTLTAKVYKPHRWRAEIRCDIPGQTSVNGIVVDTMAMAIQWVRDEYGIEPEVES